MISCGEPKDTCAILQNGPAFLKGEGRCHRIVAKASVVPEADTPVGTYPDGICAVLEQVARTEVDQAGNLGELAAVTPGDAA